MQDLPATNPPAPASKAPQPSAALSDAPARTQTEADPGGGVSPDTAADTAGQINILIVDDRKDRLLSMSAVLESTGANVVCVTSGREALRRLLRENFAVILLDVNMPDMSGFETAELIRQRNSLKNTPIIFVTAYGDEPQMVRGYSLGAVDFIHAPIIPDVLRTKVGVFVDIARMNEQLRQQARTLEQRVQERTAALESTNRQLRREVEERRKAEDALRASQDKLQEANGAMEQMLHTLSHDLKTPLLTTKWLTQSMREDINDGNLGDLSQSVNDLERTSDHMRELVDDLLHLSQVGCVDCVPGATDAGQIIEIVLDKLKDRIQDKKVHVEVHDPLPTVLADDRWLSRACENLIVNAIKYGCTEPGSTIEIGSTSDDDGSIVLFVRDHGPGIESDQHERVFEVFQRLDSNQDGTGVGLAIVARIMEMHGGRAWVESTPGHGATFCLSFNAAPANSKQPVSG